MLIILIASWQVLSYLIRALLLNQANHAIWQKSWFPRLEDKRRRQNRFDAKEWASKLAESDKPGSYYNQEKWLKDDKAPEPIETTAESSFTSSLASKASFLRRKVAKQEMKSREVQRHGNYKNRTKYCFESLL